MNVLNPSIALRSKRFTNLVPPHIHPNGDRVAFSVKVPVDRNQTEVRRTDNDKEVIGSEIWVLDMSTGKSAALTSSAQSSSWGPRWSPDGRYLAWFSQNSNGTLVYVWSTTDGVIRPLSARQVISFWGMETLQWTPDSRAVICRATPVHREATEEDQSPRDVIYLEYIPDPAAPRGYTPGWLSKFHCDVVVMEVETGYVETLCLDTRPITIKLSPDGKRLAILELMARPGLFRFESQLRILPIDRPQDAVSLLQGVSQLSGLSLSWSPSSRMILCSVTSAKGAQLLVGDIESSLVRNLIPPDLTFRQGRYAPRWAPDDSEVYWVTGGALWKFSLREGRPQNLTSGWTWRVHDLVGPVGDSEAWFPDGENLMVRVSDQDFRQGFGLVHPETGAMEVRWEAERIYLTATNGDVCRRTGALIFESQSGDDPPDFWICPHFKTPPRKLTNINPQLSEVSLGTARLLRWEDAEGTVRSAACLLPPNFDPGKRYPTVVRLYEGEGAPMVRAFGLDATSDNLHILASRGYVVVVPDIVLKGTDPRLEVVGHVEITVNHLVELGWTDEERVGVFGHSYGGYLTLGLVTVSTMFRAAVAIAAFSDLATGSLVLHRGDPAYWLRWATHGQGRMIEPPWLAAERYVRNSPLYHLDQIVTPLLLVHGTADSVPVWQAEAMYSGLRHLNKPVALVRYKDEEHWHGGWSLNHQEDYWEKVVGWFDRFLRNTTTVEHPKLSRSGC